MDMPEANEYLMDPGYMECVADILDHPVFQSMDQYIQHGTTTCKCHCIQVSYLAYKLCKRFGGNWRSAARAGLLHDLFLYDLHTHARETGDHFHGFTHPRTAIENAKRSDAVRQFAMDWYLKDEVKKQNIQASGEHETYPYYIYDEALYQAILKAEEYLKPFFSYDLDDLYAIEWDSAENGGSDRDKTTLSAEIGRASCRERV